MSTEIGRKRLRSDDRTFRQQKYLVTDRLVEQNNTILMEKIYKKTLNLMFAGVKSQRKSTNSNKHEDSLESEENNYDKIDDKLPASSIGCKLCVNNISHSNTKICSNCNLKVCDRCALNDCIYCYQALCESCINIFGCSIVGDDGMLAPICEECKVLLN